MTTYQDPPLHSRRAARQGERADAENVAAEDSAERAITAGTAEPLNYATTSRPPLPQYDGQNLRPRRTVEPADHVDLPPTEALPNQDLANYRSRDFSPEGKRSQPSWGPQYGGVGDDGTVEFHTQGRENVPVTIPENEPVAEAVTPPAEPAAPAVSAPAAVGYHPEHTMTRRELRALREAGVITDVTDLSQPIQLPVLVQPAPLSPAPVLPARVSPAVAPPAPTALAPDSAAPAGPAPEPVAKVPAPGMPAVPVPPAGLFAPEAAVELPAAVAPIADPIPLVAPVALPSTRLDSALAEFDALAAGREPLLPAPDALVPVTGRRSAGPLRADDVPQTPVDVIPQDQVDAVPEAPVIDAAPQVQSPSESQAPSAAEVFPEPAILPPSTEGLSAFDALFQPPSAAVPVVVALPLDADAEHHDVVEAVLEPDPAPVIDQLLAAPAPQGAPAPVPPPAAYPVPVDLPAPPATQSPVAAAATPFPVTPPLITPSPVVAAPIVQPADEPIAEHVASIEPAVGHWSTQADIDDAEQINESTISRSVGAGNGAITTSALVLPSIPDHTIGGPLGGGGEILLTGSISLPDSLSERGAHPLQLDESDLDHLLDPGDNQVANTDSTPVRAIRAVSTHTASGGIISPSKPKGTRGFTILIVAASAMAVVVVGLLIAGLVSGTL